MARYYPEEKRILTLEEAQELGLPEEVVVDLKFGATARVQAATLERQAEAQKKQANDILEPALQLLATFAEGWPVVGDYVGEVKSIQIDGRTFSRVVRAGSASLNKDKMKEYLVTKGVAPELVMAAIEAGTTIGAGSVSVSMKEAQRKEEL